MTFQAKLWLMQIHWVFFFSKIDGFIRVYDETRYLVIFGPEKCNTIWNNIRHLVGQKSSTAHAIFHNCSKIKIDLYDTLPL